MIQLCDNSIMVLQTDGSRCAFDVEELESRIIRSFLATGFRETWVAEDLSLSIEYVLTQSQTGESTYTKADINTLVVKVLEGAGFIDVAEHYRRQNSRYDNEIKPDLMALNRVIGKHLGLSGEHLDTTSSKVQEACKQLGIDSSSPFLILELAKYYKSKVSALKLDTPSPSIGPISTDDSVLQVSRDTIKSSLSSKTRELIDKKILNVSGISRLFPSVRIEFNIILLIRSTGLIAPLTELAVMPCFKIPADCISEIISMTRTLYEESTNQNTKSPPVPLPVYLKTIKVKEFSEEYLELGWPESEKTCHDMLDCFMNMIRGEIFKFSVHP